MLVVAVSRTARGTTAVDTPLHSTPPPPDDRRADLHGASDWVSAPPRGPVPRVPSHRQVRSSLGRSCIECVQRFHVSSDLTGGDKNMRYAMVIAMLLGSTLLAQAEPIDRDKWITQTARANKSCLAKFRQKFGDDKGRNYSGCVTDQTNKAIDDCVGSTEFSNCVLEKSLRVLEVCDLSSC
jgi:hypothetical protein